MEKIPLTAKGFAKLDAELKKLKSVERPAVIAAIAEAREHGDLSENAEYHAAREKQSFIEGRIRELEAIDRPLGGDRREPLLRPDQVRRHRGAPRRGHRRGEDLPDRRRAGGQHRARPPEPEVAAGAGADRQGARRQRRGARRPAACAPTRSARSTSYDRPRRRDAGAGRLARRHRAPAAASARRWAAVASARLGGRRPRLRLGFLGVAGRPGRAARCFSTRCSS